MNVLIAILLFFIKLKHIDITTRVLHIVSNSCDLIDPEKSRVHRIIVINQSLSSVEEN